ncbi:LANO_0H07844g1_1 [Lachancea nothofagi CBS 11611]|uniref:LANO_0H07844g1_1 n=1 Tax=Lachancea nothofagi CBS 11611 TaxID=1266666 RepID=A0A1G4KLU2_9SACH|nr:LANO_0H07844g1_1 [Lachancea nothofagi CBS 11611]
MNTGFTFPPNSGEPKIDNFKFPREAEQPAVAIPDDSPDVEQALASPQVAQRDPPVAVKRSDTNHSKSELPSLETSPHIIRSSTPLISEQNEQLSEPAVIIPAAKRENANVASNESFTNEYAKNMRQNLATDWKSSSEYALHILFTKFVRHAENKLNLCLQYPLDSEPPIVDLLGEGVDLAFDKIIESLGFISKKKPKPVIDAMMFWRKTKSEVAAVAAENVEKLIQENDLLRHSSVFQEGTRTLHSGTAALQTHTKTLSSGSKKSHGRNNSSKSYTSTSSAVEVKQRVMEDQIETAKETAFQADRKSLISIYILCRVLIEIVKQGSGTSDDDLSDKLEEIVFTQLKTTDPISISSSIIKSSNWNSFAELLGCMSASKFVTVSDRFIADLEKLPSSLPRELEPSVHLLILGMRYLKLKNYPLDLFEESADFIKSLAKFLVASQNYSICLAYAEVISQLLLPLAGSLTAEVNHPTWVEAMALILETCQKFQNDNKFWASSFKLMVTVLCVSPQELFCEQWMNLLEKNITKVKSKSLNDRVVFATGLSRLVWVYLFRCTETLNNTERRLKKLFMLFLTTKKKDNWITTDMDLINPLTDVLVTVGSLHPGFIMENVIIPLIKMSFNGSTLENLGFERLILAIDAYKGLLVTTDRPEFPENDCRFYDMNLNKISGKMMNAVSSDHEEACKSFYKLFILLDSSIGSEVWSPENEHQRQASTPFGGISSFNFGFSNENANSSNRGLNAALFAALIEALPCCLTVSGQIPFKSTIEILARNAVHRNLLIATSSQSALKALALKRNPYTLITWFAKYSFDFDEKTQSSYNLAYLSSSEYRKLLVLYIELLQCWLTEFKISNEVKSAKELGLGGNFTAAAENDATESKDTEKYEWKNTVTVIEDVEGNGLFFLCSHDHIVRRLAVQILRIVSKFDEAMLEKTHGLEKVHARSLSRFVAERGTRLIDLLQTCNYTVLVENKRLAMSVAEKARLAKLSSKYKGGILIKLAESDYGVDAALWMRTFSKLLSLIFERSPVTMALCRSIVCIRLVQLHEIILSVANNAQIESREISPQAIVNQWKLYLIVACSSLTSTSDQKLHIPTTNHQHGRNKSQQIFTVQHQKIKSATSIFKMVLPLLNCQNAFVKDAIITGLSSMNVNIFKAYLQSVDMLLHSWRVDSSSNGMRIEIFHILAVLASFFTSPTVLDDEWILRKLSQYLKDAKRFLEIKHVQSSFQYQLLRSYFAGLLSNYFLAVKKHPLVDELFPFEARASCFNFLKEWCGYGQDSTTSTERYHDMRENQSLRDRGTLSTAMEFQKTRLELIALEAMVNLCCDTITKTINEIPDSPIYISFDISGLVSWIDSLFNSHDERVRRLGTVALKGLLENNKQNYQLHNDTLMQYSLHNLDTRVATFYYTAVCDSLLRMESFILPEDDVVSLGLSGLYNESNEVRSFSIDILSAIETKNYKSSYTKVFKERLANDSKTVYKSTAKEISTIFAELPSGEVRLKIFSIMCRNINFLKSELKQDILTLLVPWVHKFTLKNIDDAGTFMVLNNLFAITVEHNNRYPMEIEQLWISLGKGNGFQNIHVALDYILSTSISSRNPKFVKSAKDVVLYLANVPGGMGVIDSFMINLEPKHMIPETSCARLEMPTGEKYAFVANVWKLLAYRGKEVVFSKAQLSIIYLVNLLTIPNDSMKNKVPLLLHICFSLIDHYVPIIHESAAKILSDLIFGLVPTHEKAEETVSLIKDRAQIWAYDNLVRDKNGARSPKAMDSLVRNVVSLFSTFENLQIDWQNIALKWATTCPVRHVACRSFQVFRSLLTFLDKQMLRDMLHRLSNTVSDDNPEIQGFAMQILMTLNAVTAELSPAKLIDFPQMFWALVACLSSVHEQEFVEVLSSLTKFVSKIDLDSPDTVQCLIATFPSSWEGRFDGLQQTIMGGLRSHNSWDIALGFLDRLNLFKDSRIIANSNSRVLFALLANLPRFLNAMDEEEFDSDIKKAAESLIVLANSNSQPSLARLVDSLSKNKFRSKKDFLSQVVSFISRVYFPDYSAQTLVFLMGLLFNKTDWVKTQTLQLLQHIVPLIDLSRPEFTGVGADLISPLLRLLLTEYESQALEVLNSVRNVSGSKMDKDVLRISMGNKDAKISYSRTATLFGIPEESGWSVPMPTMTAATTRHNVHAVFTTCSDNASDDPVQREPDNLADVVEFHADGGYAAATTAEINDTTSIVEDKDGSLSHMWAELDNLDTFFTTEAGLPEAEFESKMFEHGHSNSGDTMHAENPNVLESAPQIYDKKVSVILNHSLTRTPSNVSFKTNLADSFGTSMHGGPHVLKDNVSSQHSRVGSNPARSVSSGQFQSGKTAPRASQIAVHHGGDTISPTKIKGAENPELLFRFEGILRNPNRTKKKWQKQQHQQQQLLAQTFQDEHGSYSYERDSSASLSPVIGGKTSPPLSPVIISNGKHIQPASKDVTKQKGAQNKSKTQKHHYHLPHFSSRLSDGKLTPPLSGSSAGFSLRSSPSPRPAKVSAPSLPLSAQSQLSKRVKSFHGKSRMSTGLEGTSFSQETPVQKLMQDRNLEDDLMIEKQLLSLQDELQNRTASGDVNSQ